MTVARTTRWRVVGASTIGTIVEWYDFYLYGTAAALVLNRVFFSNLTPLAGILASYATFAVGFLVRPFGGVIFGHFGDKYGRKPILIATLLLMGFATAGIGLLPTYKSIGIVAPILLLSLRMLQGLGAGRNTARRSCSPPNTTATAADSSPAGRRPRRISQSRCRRECLRCLS